METDSDSDGSHISATPPRDIGLGFYSPPPAPPPPVPPRPLLIPSHEARSRVSLSDPISRSKISPKRKPVKTKKRISGDDEADPFPSADLSNIAGFTVKIHRSSSTNRVVSAPNSVEILPAGYFSSATTSSSSVFKLGQACKSIPFSSLHSTEVDSAEIDGNAVPLAPSVTCSQPDDIGNCDQVLGSHTDSIKVSVNLPEKRVKRARKHINLIGATVNLPEKKLKNASEGNFVKLNLNGGHRFKFCNKGGRRIAASRGRKLRWRKRYKSGNTHCDEDGLNYSAHEDSVSGIGPTVETPLQKGGKLKFNGELIDEAVVAVREDPSDQNLKNLLKLTHGFDFFRNGQLEAIKQVLGLQSTMLVLPTGAGKSLCYQLPALVLPGVTLVVSPLVALMLDQLRQLPPMIPGGLLCSTQTSNEVSETIARVREGNIKVLFVSPERFLNAEFLSTFGALPLISLVVVDEAHCLSEWSHNFRPSYLRLRASLLQTSLNVKCILAMTATATARTLHSIMSALEIPDVNLIQSSQIRKNLQLYVTLSENRLKDLMLLMKSASLVEIKSIIIYCKFQSETDLVSKYLRDNSISAKSYHSGIPAKDRTRIQQLFYFNKIRVVVATVAFGMGLDKSDVGAVIHYSLPESLEEYVQETGRAGRDGRLSYCHLLFDEKTYFKLRSLLYSDGVDEYAVNKLLCQVFTNDMKFPRKVCSMIIESASRKFDMKEEVIVTILTYLEIAEVHYLHLLPQLNVTCTLYFHKTPPALLSSKDIVVAAILKQAEFKHGHYVFDLPTLANTIGITTNNLLSQMQNLKFLGEITYELKDPAFCYTIVKIPEDICSLTTKITRWLSEVERCKVQKLDSMLNAATFAAKLCKHTDGCKSTHHTSCLQSKILEYFSEDHDGPNVNFSNKMGESSRFLRADIKVFLQSNSQAKFTPRAVARILHGISSPAFPSATWFKTHFWGRYSPIDFPVVMEAAAMELINFVGKGIS